VFPSEVTLEIFKFVSLQDQARLAQVDKRFNQLANNQSLDLFNYKTENKKIDIENVSLRIIKTNLLRSGHSYRLYTKKDGIKVANSGMRADTIFFNDFVKTMEKSPSSMIEFLKQNGGTASLNAKFLEEALNKKNENKRITNKIFEVCTFL
jgi:hypothetical protein